MPGVWQDVDRATKYHLYRLKSNSGLVEKIQWLLALGVDASALEEVFGVREMTIR
jgi:hypothetical protein